MKNYPDYFFLSAWNHKNEILNKEKSLKLKVASGYFMYQISKLFSILLCYILLIPVNVF